MPRGPGHTGHVCHVSHSAHLTFDRIELETRIRFSWLLSRSRPFPGVLRSPGHTEHVCHCTLCEYSTFCSIAPYISHYSLVKPTCEGSPVRVQCPCDSKYTFHLKIINYGHQPCQVTQSQHCRQCISVENCTASISDRLGNVQDKFVSKRFP